jgi:anti-sigma-K factor RskA
MEASDEERQRAPRTTWWQWLAGLGAAFTLVFALNTVVSWSIQSQTAEAVTPMLSRQDKDQLVTKHDLEMLNVRLSRLEAAFDWAPTLRAKAADTEFRR